MLAPSSTSNGFLGLKDQAQYGFEDITGQKLLTAWRQARALVASAERVLGR